VTDQTGLQPPEPTVFDPLYIAARSVLLDALFALAPHGKAIIIAGAQAVYLRTGLTDIAIAPYTTDGDLALDPTLLSDDPELEAAMERAGFHLLPHGTDSTQPGAWIATREVRGEGVIVPVDLIVPDAAATGGRHRGARLGPHGNRAARRSVGLEAVLVDHDTMTVAALDPRDGRSIDVEVAGVAALLVAKAHKIHDRSTGGRPDRLKDKDASDVVRMMQTSSPRETGPTLARLRTNPIAGEATSAALQYLNDLFGRRAGEGVRMAQRALRLAIPEDQLATLCVAYTERMLQAAKGD
jgi:hypothetical protein